MRAIKLAAACCTLVAALAPAGAAAQPAQTQRQSGGLVLHYGLVPAEMVIAVPRPQAEVMTHITLVGGASTSKRLEPMNINDLPSFGAFVPVGAPGIYKIRFEVKRPGVEGTVSAEFEHRVAEPRRQGKRR